jgi:hypothetical protein
MTRVEHVASAMVAVALAAIGIVHAQQAGQTARGGAAPTVALIGCVERVIPAKPPAAGAATASAPAYKLTDEGL